MGNLPYWWGVELWGKGGVYIAVGPMVGFMNLSGYYFCPILYQNNYLFSFFCFLLLAQATSFVFRELGVLVSGCVLDIFGYLYLNFVRLHYFFFLGLSFWKYFVVRRFSLRSFYVSHRFLYFTKILLIYNSDGKNNDSYNHKKLFKIRWKLYH